MVQLGSNSGLFSSKAHVHAVALGSDSVRHCIRMSLEAGLHWRRRALRQGEQLVRSCGSLGRISGRGSRTQEEEMYKNIKVALKDLAD